MWVSEYTLRRGESIRTRHLQFQAIDILTLRPFDYSIDSVNRHLKFAWDGNVTVPSSGDSMKERKNCMRGPALTLVLFLGFSPNIIAQQTADLAGTISMSGAWALYPMAVRWGEEFQKLHPKVRFDISAGGAGKGMTDALASAVDIGLVSREVNQAEFQKGAFVIAVAKDAVVPMISTRNPAYRQLMRNGAKLEVFKGIWVRGDITFWNQVVDCKTKAPIHVYTRSDACGAADTWAMYLGRNQEDLKGIGVYGDPGLGEAVRRDPVAIGYNNINFAYDANTGKPVAGLDVLPLDVNTNGVIDKAERFYATQNDLVTAIARGDYPSPPARDLYFVTKGKPATGLVTAFVLWALKDGQKYVGEAGYIRLPTERMSAEIKKLE